MSFSWAADDFDSDFPPLPTDSGGGTKEKNKGKHKAPPAPPPKKATLPSSLTSAADITAGNALQALTELADWADGRKDGPTKAPPVWWQEMSLRIRACITALAQEGPRMGPTLQAAADHAQSGGSLPRDGGSALADVGVPLDCGSTVLAKIMDRLDAQHANVMRAIAGIPSVSGPAHNANTPPRPPAPPAPPGAPIPAPPQNPSLSLAINLTDLDADSPLLKQSAAELKLLIESHLAASSAPHLSMAHIHSIRRDRTKIYIHAITLAQKTALARCPDEWLTKIDPKAAISVRKIALQANLVSTKFNASAPTAIAALASSNPTVITDSDDVLSVRWLHDTKRGKTSAHSSLVITVTNADTARDLISHGICILGENCPVQVQPPTAHQCRLCQHFGHISTTCRDQPHPHPRACARCACKDHYTSNCECPAPVKCTDMRTCTHIKLKCVNCGGAHKSFASICPVKANEIAKALSSPAYVALVRELTAPPARGGATRL